MRPFGASVLASVLGGLSVLGCLAGPAAHAEERPQLLPDQDVTVTYGNDGWQGHRVSYSAAAQMFRIDHDSSPSRFFLMDPRSGAADIVFDRHRVVAPVPDLSIWPNLLAPGMTFTRVRTDVVLGTACTEWRMIPAASSNWPDSEEWVVCITANGVVLRFENSMVGETATSIVYEPLGVARFKVPASYRSITAEASRGLE